MSGNFSRFILFLTVCATLLVFVYSGCRSNEADQIRAEVVQYENEKMRIAEEAIEKSPELQKLDKFCRQISLPPDFRFVRLDLPDTRKTFLSYYFQSETNYEDVKEFFREYFRQNNWEFETGLSSYPKAFKFRKNNYTTEINSGGTGKRAYYLISCEKLK